MTNQKMAVDSVPTGFTQRHQVRLDQFQIRCKMERDFMMCDERSAATANKTRFAPQKLIADPSPLRRTASTRRRFAFEPFG